MQHSNVPGEGFDISRAMNQGVAHVAADRACSFRDQQNAPATPRLGSHQRAAFFDGRENEDIALAHKVSHIIAESKDLHTRVREPPGEPLRVARNELSRDEKRSVLVGGRPNPASSA